MQERIFRRASTGNPSAGVAATAAAGAAAAVDTGVAAACRRGVTAARVHLCGRRRQRGGWQRRRCPPGAVAHERKTVPNCFCANQVVHVSRGPRGGQRGGQADRVPPPLATPPAALTSPQPLRCPHPSRYPHPHPLRCNCPTAPASTEKCPGRRPVGGGRGGDDAIPLATPSRADATPAADRLALRAATAGGVKAGSRSRPKPVGTPAITRHA